MLKNAWLFMRYYLQLSQLPSSYPTQSPLYSPPGSSHHDPNHLPSPSVLSPRFDCLRRPPCTLNNVLPVSIYIERIWSPPTSEILLYIQRILAACSQSLPCLLCHLLCSSHLPCPASTGAEPHNRWSGNPWSYKPTLVLPTPKLCKFWPFL